MTQETEPDKYLAEMQDRLLIEFEKNGTWYGTTRQNTISNKTRLEALKHLTETPERYYYPPYLGGRFRISFLESIF